MDNKLLTIDKISVKYGSIEALHEVSMSVNKGDIVALIGANGAGKSTLLKAIMAQVPLSNGSITFENSEIASAKKHIKTTHQLASLGMALVPEGRHVFADMTVEENLFIAAGKGKVDSDTVDWIFELMPRLAERRKQLAGTFCRRIECYAEREKTCVRGEQCGIIKFGSRIDIYLPLDADIKVGLGEEVRACETVIAELKKK